MNIFHKNLPGVGQGLTANQVALVETVFNSINDGVVIIDANGIVKLMNPSAARMTGNSHASDGVGLSYLSLLKMENGEGMEIVDSQNPLAVAVANNTAWESRDYYLVTLQGNRIPVAISMIPSGGRNADRIITFRNIAQELEKEGEQTEFISTASHEMRTPVASIEGYLGLALNPQTATIDDRARQYLNEAHSASQHLGKLFQDLLDVTKLDDKRIKLHMVPTEMISTVKDMIERQISSINEKGLSYSFGSEKSDNTLGVQVNQTAYAMVDLDFLQEILNNLIENAVKYTDSGGAIWANVLADGDNVLINVTDTGMGISPDNLTHIFQKFYRVDNSATRTIGGTGLGLYIVKERVEAMGGRVWAESAFGEGSTFYVSFPRISQEEYDRQRLVIKNMEQMPITTNSSPLATGLGTATMKAVTQPITNQSANIPTQVAQAVQTAQTAQPAQPAQPVQPVQIVQATQPVQPAQPTAAPVQAPATTGSSDQAPDLPPDQLAAMKQQFAEQIKSSQNNISNIK